MHSLKSILLIIIFLSAYHCFSQTIYVSGDITSNTTWSSDTVKVTGNVFVDLNITLTVLPGTYVEFQGYYRIFVMGKVLANGNINDSITFTVNDTTGYNDQQTNAGGWTGFYVVLASNTDSSVFNYCKFLYCKDNGIMSSSCYVKVENCHFSYGFTGICFMGNMNPEITNNVFNNLYGTAIYVADTCHANIIHNTISKCDIGINLCKTSGEITGNMVSNCDLYGIYLQLSIGSNIRTNQVTGCTNMGICVNQCHDVLISENTIQYNNQGVHYDGSRGVIQKNIIAYNSCQNGGSGLYCKGLDILIIQNKICNNQVTIHNCTDLCSGGGIQCFKGTFNVVNNIICNNTAIDNGGGISAWDSSNITLVNNTIANNLSTTGLGGGVYIRLDLNAELINNVMWGNVALIGQQMNCWDPNYNVQTSFCNLPDTVDANISAAVNFNDMVLIAPAFANPSAGAGIAYNGVLSDWSLQANSPDINRGSYDTTGLHLFNTDIAGNPRITGGRIDVGAFEYSSPNFYGPENNNDHGSFIIYYPNPAKEQVNVTIVNPGNIKFQLRMTDATGKIVLNENTLNANYVINKTIDFSLFPKGIYTISAVNEAGTKYSKLLVKE